MLDCLPRCATAIVSALGAILLSPSFAQAAEDALSKAAGEDVQLVMRHAIAPGTGDPDEFTLGDCSTQRNLSETGREQAAAIGRKLEEAGVKVDVVYSSEWCRARQTAELLGLAPVESASFLNSFFEDRTEATRQNRAFRDKLEELAEEGRKALFVTHQVNITELTGVYPASGEIVLVTLDENGEVEPGGSIHE